MNGLITEGLPLGIPVQILTSGLSLGEPPPPPEEVASSGMLYLGITAILTTGLYYNLPVTSTRFTLQVTGTVTSVTVNLSNDGIIFTTKVILVAAGITNYISSARWIQVVNVGTGVVVRINARREKF